MQQPVTITYCKPCGYLPRARAVAAAVEDALGLPCVLEAGAGGRFEIAYGGAVVARRTRAGFPSPVEVVEALRTQQAGA